MNATLERARACIGLRQINITVAASQSAAATLYRSLGFESFGCERDALKIDDMYIDEDWMPAVMNNVSSRNPGRVAGLWYLLLIIMDHCGSRTYPKLRNGEETAALVLAGVCFFRSRRSCTGRASCRDFWPCGSA